MIEVMTNAGGDEGTQLRRVQVLCQVAGVDEYIHHLSNTEAMSEIVKWIVLVVLLYFSLQNVN
jgi:hypothetical protein